MEAITEFVQSFLPWGVLGVVVAAYCAGSEEAEKNRELRRKARQDKNKEI